VGGADHYEVLNVERTASTAEIKSAYRKLVRQVHPDQGGNAALFRLVQDAWNTLAACVICFRLWHDDDCRPE